MAKGKKGSDKSPPTTTTSGGLKRKTVYFDPEEWEAIRRACFDQDVSYSSLVREAVRGHLGLPPGKEIRPGPRGGKG